MKKSNRLGIEAIDKQKKKRAWNSNLRIKLFFFLRLFRPENKNQTNYFLVNDLEFPSGDPKLTFPKAYVVSSSYIYEQCGFLVVMLTL